MFHLSVDGLKLKPVVVYGIVIPSRHSTDQVVIPIKLLTHPFDKYTIDQSFWGRSQLNPATHHGAYQSASTKDNV